MHTPRISFGMIVLNGEPFLRYNLRAIYPFAQQIIVVEGASHKASHAATPDGHSVDGTRETLRRFQAEEDPENKLVVVTAEDEGHPDGFWPGEKDQQSQAYAKRASGDWLWQVDVDEFYQPEDLRRVSVFLARNPDLSCLTFRAIHFWGGLDYTVEGGLFLSRRFQGEAWGAYRRLFRWRPGYQYLTHRPPTVADSAGLDVTPRRRRSAERAIPGGPVRMYHYLMLFPEQVMRKSAYYARQAWEWDRDRVAKNSALMDEVSLENGLQIYDQHGTRNWLARFTGSHPPQIEALRADMAAGRVALAPRRSDDIERLLEIPAYQAAVAAARPEELRRAWADQLSYLLWRGPRSQIGRWIRSGPLRPLRALVSK